MEEVRTFREEESSGWDGDGEVDLGLMRGEHDLLETLPVGSRIGAADTEVVRSDGAEETRPA